MGVVQIADRVERVHATYESMCVSFDVYDISLEAFGLSGMAKGTGVSIEQNAGAYNEYPSLQYWASPNVSSGS